MIFQNFQKLLSVDKSSLLISCTLKAHAIVAANIAAREIQGRLLST